MKPAVGDHGINASAESAAKSPNLQDGRMVNMETIASENKKRDVAHKGEMPVKKEGGIV